MQNTASRASRAPPFSLKKPEREHWKVHTGNLNWSSTEKISGVYAGVPCWHAHD